MTTNVKHKISTSYPRFRGEFQPVPVFEHSYTQVQKRKNMSDVVTSGTLLRQCPGEYIGEGMWDVVTPRFLEQAKTRLIVNPMKKKFGWVDSSQATCPGTTDTVYMGNLAAQASGFTYRGTYTYNSFCPDYFSTNFQYPTRLPYSALCADAINEAFAASHQRDVMGVVDLLEMDKTVDMLRCQLGRIDKIRDKSLFKGKLKVVRKNRNLKIQEYQPKSIHGRAADSAGLWLETQYGILPLMMSIEGLVKALGTVSEKANIQTYRGNSVAQDNLSKTKVVTSTWTGLLSYTDTYSVTIDQSINARAGVISRYSPSLRARLGMETRDLVPAGYELIKFSFLLDWWLDIGTYLEAVTPVKGFTSEASWLTTFVEEVVTLAFSRASVSGNIYSDGSWYGSLSALNTSLTYGTRERIRTPGVVPRIPQINSTFKSVRHAVSAAALAVSSHHARSNTRI